MRVKIEYKTDNTDPRYCAFAYIEGRYYNGWSSSSFEEAEERLMASIKLPKIEIPNSKEVEVNV